MRYIPTSVLFLLSLPVLSCPPVESTWERKGTELVEIQPVPTVPSQKSILNDISNSQAIAVVEIKHEVTELKKIKNTDENIESLLYIGIVMKGWKGLVPYEVKLKNMNNFGCPHLYFNEGMSYIIYFRRSGRDLVPYKAKHIEPSIVSLLGKPNYRYINGTPKEY